MHQIDEILAALGATGAPPEAGKNTVKVATTLDKDAKDKNVMTKTEPETPAPATAPATTPATSETPATPETPAQPDLVSLVRSLAQVVQENNTAMTGLTSEFAEIKKTLARNEEAIAKLATGPATDVSATGSDPTREQIETIQRTQDALTAAKNGQTELKFSPSGAVIRPRTPVQ